MTILSRIAQPLIRYEVTDSMVVHDETCACGSGHSWISDLNGRLEESFRYPSGPSSTPPPYRDDLCASLT